MRDRLTYANVMATIAVFIALGGGAFAAVKLKKNAVKTRNIKNQAVTEPKLGDKAVATAKIGDKQVKHGKLGELAVENDKLADGAVSRAKTDFLVSSGRVVSNPADGNTLPVPLFSFGGVTVTGSCSDVIGVRSATFGLTGPADSFYAGVQATDTQTPDDVTSSLPDSVVGIEVNSTRPRQFTSLKVVTPTSVLQVDVIVAVDQAGSDCVFAASGSAG